MMRFLLMMSALFATLPVLHVQATPASYAGNMVSDCWPSGMCDRNTIKLSIPGEILPEKGIVFAFGNLLSPRVSFKIIDFDRHTVIAIDTELDRQTGTVTVVSKQSAGASDATLGTIVALANDLWNSKTPAVQDQMPEACTDSSNDLTLFDGPRALHYLSLCPPKGIAGAMESWVETQLKKPSPTP